MPSTNCPVCDSATTQLLYPEFFGTCISSDMMVLPNTKLDNRNCRDCGLIFNAAGTRGVTEQFYRSSYSLMMQNPDAAIQNFSGPKPVSQAERSYDFLREMIPLAATGKVLEVGAGKGDFLGHFIAGFPDWKIHACEPSNACDVLQERIKNAQVLRGEYNDTDLAHSCLDLIVALGVLEHVVNPLDMLRWASQLLKPGGFFYIRVPNFANNPNDLFAADHLSKLTVATVRTMAEATGFEVTAIKEAGVPVFMALRSCGANVALHNVFSENAPILTKNVDVAQRSMATILAARETANEKDERFGVFGLGAAGLFAPFFAGFEPAEITAYIDENKTVWGSKIHERPVGGLDLIHERDIRHVALAISPVYFGQVREKLKPYGVRIYSA